MNQYIRNIFIFFLFFSTNALSSETEFFGEFVQGGVIIGQNKQAKKVFFDNLELELNNEGYFI